MPLATLIAAHKAAWERLGTACDRADEVRARREGRTVTADDNSEWLHAHGAEAAALGALASYVAAGPAELRQWAAHLQTYAKHNDVLAPIILPAVLRSLSVYRPAISGGVS